MAEENSSKEVDKFISTLKHPLKGSVQPLREIILSNKGVSEHIKWNAPSFVYKGGDKITFNFSKKDKILLIFHRGAKVRDAKSKENLFEDQTGLLSWLSSDRAVITISDGKGPKTSDFGKVVKTWLKASA